MECIFEILLLILAILFSILLYQVFESKAAILPVILGGGLCTASLPEKPASSNMVKSNIYIDGCNMLCAVFPKQRYYSILEFSSCVYLLSEKLTKSFPNIKGKIHLIIKNSCNQENNTISIKSKNTRTPYVTSEIQDRYVKVLSNIAKKFPKIIYHYAKSDKDYSDKKYESVELHHKKGRDDFVTLYLAMKDEDSYLLSLDNYRDFKDFGDIDNFTHFTITDKEISKEEVNVNSKYAEIKNKRTNDFNKRHLGFGVQVNGKPDLEKIYTCPNVGYEAVYLI
jgi:hypothetical protein